MTNLFALALLLLGLLLPPPPPLAIRWHTLVRTPDGTITAIVTHSGGWLVTITCATADGTARGAGGGEVAPYPDRQAFVFAEHADCDETSRYTATIMRRDAQPAVSTPARVPDRPIFLPLLRSAAAPAVFALAPAAPTIAWHTHARIGDMLQLALAHSGGDTLALECLHPDGTRRILASAPARPDAGRQALTLAPDPAICPPNTPLVATLIRTAPPLAISTPPAAPLPATFLPLVGAAHAIPPLVSRPALLQRVSPPRQ